MNPQRFRQTYSEEALRTIRIILLFEEGDLALKPADGSMSTAQQIEHICQSANFLRGVLEEDVPSRHLFDQTYDVSSVASAVRSAESAMREVQRASEAVSQAKWDEKISPFGPEWLLSRGEHARLMIDHEIHHRGQLHVYARIAGKTPPFLYSPVDEQELLKGIAAEA